jgi:hypothetical protein
VSLPAQTPPFSQTWLQTALTARMRWLPVSATKSISRSDTVALTNTLTPWGTLKLAACGGCPSPKPHDSCSCAPGRPAMDCTSTKLLE